MSKVICDICGTTYPETAENCPICGYAQFPDVELTEEDLLMEEPLLTRNKGGRYVQANSNRKNKEIFDYDRVNPQSQDEDEDEDEEEEYEEEDDEEYEERSESSVVTVIVLVMVIMLLLAAIGFVFFRFFLPAVNSNREKAPAVQSIATEATETEETTIPTIPCTDLILNEAPRSLSKEGQFYLLNVKVLPADTTDELTYVSGDESIVTVTGGGRIVAVGEGETTVYITCGKMQINCPITVKYEEETQTPTEETLETEATEEASEETEATEGDPSKIVLKLKSTDRSLAVGYGFTLELDCDLDPSQVEWSVEHGYIASVDDKGFVLAKASGTTAVIVRYGDQEVQCIIRCK